MAVAVQPVADETHDAGQTLIQPCRELAALCGDFEMRQYLFGSYCRAVKPSAEPVATAEAPDAEAAIDPASRIAAE